MSTQTRDTFRYATSIWQSSLVSRATTSSWSSCALCMATWLDMFAGELNEIIVKRFLIDLIQWFQWNKVHQLCHVHSVFSLDVWLVHHCGCHVSYRCDYSGLTHHFRNIGTYNFHSQLYEPEVRYFISCVQILIIPNHFQLHASVFSFMLALSGMAVIGIMFTNKLYLILKKSDKDTVPDVGEGSQ